MTTPALSASLLIGFLLACGAAYLAYIAKALTRSGAFAAAILGTIVFGMGGIKWAAVLLTFFVTSSLLSYSFKKRKKEVSEKYDKGERRDAYQVLANGGIAGFFVVLHAFYPQSPWLWLAFTASLAAANADTWATELGVLSPVQPRLITSGKSVPEGTSGGVTLTGTLAAGGGALVVSLAASIFSGFSFPILILLTLCGLAGSLVDSLLGATIQAIYFCPICNKETEKHPTHGCGAKTNLIRGWDWLNNDLVNVGCTLSSPLLLMLVYLPRILS